MAATCADCATNEKVTAFLMNPEIFPNEIAKYDAEIEAKLVDPNLLEWICEVLSHRIVGEDLNKQLLFLIALSYKTDDPQGSIINGPPAIGKSHLAKHVLSFFPNVINLSRITPTVLDRLNVDLSHYILFISELQGAEQAAPTLRVMLSEGELRLATTEMNEGRLVPRVIETLGKPVYVTTTTQQIVERQLASRTWLQNLDASEEQTKKILAFQAKRATRINTEDFSHEEMVLKCLIYKLQPFKVLIPYAEKLNDLFPAKETQARRDFKRLLAVIKVITLLFQKQRILVDTRGEKALVATLRDLAFALKFLKPILLLSLYALPDKAFDVLKYFESAHEGCTTKEVSLKLGMSQNRTREIMYGLVERGFLAIDESSRTYLFSWTKKELEEPSILSIELSEGFFGEEEFKKWWFENSCSYYTGWRDAYQTFILSCTPHTPEQLQSIEKKEEISLSTKNKSEETSIESIEPILNESFSNKKKAIPLQHILPAEKCELCGEHPVEFEFENDGCAIRRCPSCIDKMKSQSYNFKLEESAL